MSHPGLCQLATRLGMQPATLALAWLLQRDNVIVIPRTSNRPHLEENHAALEIRLDTASLTELDRLFPPPDCAVPLEVL